MEPAGCVMRQLDSSLAAYRQPTHLASAEAADERAAADLSLWVQQRKELDQLSRLHAGPDLDADGVCQATEVLDVRAVQLPRPVAEPDRVRRERVVRAARGTFA